MGRLYAATAISLIGPCFLQLLHDGQSLQQVIRQRHKQIDEVNPAEVHHLLFVAAPAG